MRYVVTWAFDHPVLFTVVIIVAIQALVTLVRGHGE